MMIWENVYGTYNGWQESDRILWRKAVRILRRFSDLLTSDAWDPFYPAAQPGVFIHRWPGEGMELFTLLNHGEVLKDQLLFEVEKQQDRVLFDLWNGMELAPAEQDGKVLVRGMLERLGCVLSISKGMVTDDFRVWLADRGRIEQEIGMPSQQPTSAAREAGAEPQAGVAFTNRKSDPPPGMVFIPEGEFYMRLEHETRECGCYSDGEPEDEAYGAFCNRLIGGKRTVHEIGPIRLPRFFMDETAVTNGQYLGFLEATGYTPRHGKNFLNHWAGGELPDQLEDYPMVYVDLDDARAYARWAGKRLPTEAEWHYAAQGTDGRAWPWGDVFDPNKCNTTGRLMPAKSLPEGRSPFGCYHMAGNVWEWTESERCDGHTRYCMIRGGSYFKALGSVWYMPGGPQPNTHHAKFIRMWPGLDRCATIGFRCVMDA